MTTRPRTIGVGDHLPHLVLPTVDGSEVHLKEYHGRKLVLFCWASW
jgi:peroxiredoxin